MATQDTKEKNKVKLPPSIDGKQERGSPCKSLVDLNMDFREFLEGHSDQSVNPGPAFPDNPQPQDQNQNKENEEEGNDVLGLAFPRKLWMIVENDAFKSVHWNDRGDTVIIDADLFQTEILQRRGAERFFETDSWKTFIQELNLYGFSKIHQTNSSDHSPENKRIMIYCNSNFKRDNPLLLQNIQRKFNFPQTIVQPKIYTPSPKRPKLAATRHSPRFQKDNSMQETNQTSHNTSPNVQGPRGSSAFMASNVWSLSSVIGRSMENCPLTQSNVPSEEGTSQQTIPASLATAGPAGAGALPMGPTDYPDSASIMHLFNMCYSILMGALSVMSPNEPFDEQQESPSDYHCVLCEQFKDQPPP
ncbi:heat shock transcription factor, X-linked member 3-like [Tamandua tetradactyla]|uniref:heat shock transcription factor, X-linked member 3-like n=1 Tax=Tamandua tetradactyla TaxID=48850 RepID=UPI00405463D2